MKKGLSVALFTVTWACIQVSSSFAIAPTISDIADVIIGDLENATDPSTDGNRFVFADAINLRTVVTNAGDLSTDADHLQWSFWSTDGTYLINGRSPLTTNELTLGLGPALAPTNKRLDNDSDGDTAAAQPEDSDPYTITFRNANFSPFGGPYTDPGTGDGIVSSETRTITLFASTTTTFGSKTMVVFTANNTSDSLSGAPGDTFLAEFDFKIPATSVGWLSGAILGTATATQSATNGICLEVPGPGDNIALWVSPDNLIPLMDHAVYRVRAHVNSDQSATDAIPLFNVNYDNFQGAVAGFSNYGGERWMWDGSGAGGSQGIGRGNGRDVFEVWFAPLTFDFASWRTANPAGSTAFDPASDDVNDIRMTFRILDLGGGADPLGATLDAGTICVERMHVSTVLLPTMQANATAIYNPPLNDGLVGAGEIETDPGRTHFPQSADNATAFPGVSADIINGEWTVSMGAIPAGGGIVRATLGPDVVAAGGFTTPQGTLNPLRFFPIMWETDTVYMTQADVRNGGGGSDPVDVQILNFEAFGAELGGLDFVTNGADLSGVNSRGGTDGGGMRGASSPPTGTAQTLYAFVNGNNEPANPLGVTGANGWKAQLDLFNRSDLGGGSSSGLDQYIASNLDTSRVTLDLIPDP